MSEQVLRNGNAMARSKTRTITQIAMLGAIAGILMNLEFPLPFLAPTFYQLDFSEIPVLDFHFLIPVHSYCFSPLKLFFMDMSHILLKENSTSFLYNEDFLQHIKNPGSYIRGNEHVW